MTDDSRASDALGPDSAAPRDAGVAAPAASSTYDAVPYSVGAFPQTRPDRLATVGTLFGMHPAPPSRCRVLELGCAAGGNLLPMAVSDPESRFVGIDLSARQIDDARATARELGLRNADLHCLSILDVDERFGAFDYVLCHGVYSWVPPNVQEKILQICAANLAPGGVAYVSYNTYPGWHARGAIREMLWYHTERFAEPAERIRQARGLLAFLVVCAGRGGGGAFASLLRQELAVLQATPDTYLLHEHLEEFNEPLYFHQFAGRAARHGLQYLGEAQMSSMVPGVFGAEAEKLLRGISPDLLHMEQYMDFLRNRMFRQTLLCHDAVKLDFTLRSESVTGLRVASPAKTVSAQFDPRPDVPEEFRTPAGVSLKTSDPLMKASMDYLGRRWPLSVAFPDLLSAARTGVAAAGGAPSADDARQLAIRLLNCYTSNLVEFSISPPGFVVEVSERPVASPYARLRARDGSKVNNLRLEAVALTEPSRLVLRHLDGQHDRESLVRLVVDWIIAAGAAKSDPLSTAGDDDPLRPAELRAAAYVDALLQAFARSALLVG